MEEPEAPLSLSPYEICHTNASIFDVVKHKNIRLLSVQGIADIKGLILRDGFRTGSFAQIVELTVAERTPLHTIARAYRSDQTVPSWTSIQTIGVADLLNIEEDADLMKTRRYRLVDGSHRLAALQEHHREAKEAGDDELAEKYGRIPVVVLHGLSEEAIGCLPRS